MSEEYAVEAIVGWRYHHEKKRKEYKIKWANYPSSANSWEPEDNLNCEGILKTFVKSLSVKQSRYYHYKNPEYLTGFQRNAKFVECIGADGPHDSDIEENSGKTDRQNFYCLVIFEDSSTPEEITTDEFFEYQPKAAFEFFENRLVYKRGDSSNDDKSRNPKKKKNKLKKNKK